jgi:hypothetical protein
MSRSPHIFLQRSKLRRDFLEPRPRYTYRGLLSHRRPVPVLPSLLAPDRPADKVHTVPKRERVSYEGDVDRE